MSAGLKTTACCFAACSLLAAVAAFGPHGGARARQLQPVDLELVLAIDTSTSVDPVEFALQRQGLAEAFLHPDVVRAIRGAGDLGIAVTLVQWSARNRQRSVVDWMLVRDAAGAARLSAKIGKTGREIAGLTDIASAIGYSVSRIEDNAYAGQRLVVDISGDGTSDPARSEVQRDRAVARGITINGLVIHNEDHDLGELAKLDLSSHYARHVIGGSGAFMMTAADYTDFQVAIRRKLVREISGPIVARLACEFGASRFCRIEY